MDITDSEPFNDYEDSDFDDDDFDGCLHGVPWDEPCGMCDENEYELDGNI